MSRALLVEPTPPATFPAGRTISAVPSAVVNAAVLVVASRPTSREALQRTLSAARFSPAAVDRDSAVEELRRSATAGRPFPVVLLDARTREAVGFEVAAQIRCHPELSRTRIVLMVAGGRRGDAARCRELGISAYLTKPLKRADLIAAIAMVREADADALSIPLVTRHLVGGHSAPLRVLVAEDDAAIRKLVSRILEKRGHSVVTAGNGREALAALERESFDVLLTDVEMPELDGLHTLEAVREREKKAVGRRLAVVAFTGHALETDRERLLEAGMDGYVAKPIVAEQLFFTLESLAGGRATPDGRRPPPSGSAAFDHRALLVEVDGDINLLDFMVSIFREDWPRRVGELETAIQNRCPEDLAEAAHALKGSIGTFRAANAFETARRLEFLGRQGDFDGAEEALRALVVKLRRLEARLTRFIEEKKT